MTVRNLPEKQPHQRPNPDQALRELGAVVQRYRERNDRFERWLNERDSTARGHQRTRLASVDGRGEHQGRR